jgi:hypothetical protein
MNKIPDESSAAIVVQPPNGLPQELVSGYLEGCRKDLVAVKADLAMLEYERLRCFGHQLKGTGRPYGFPVLTQLGTAIEEAAVHKDAAELADLIHRLDAYVSRVKIVSG